MDNGCGLEDIADGPYLTRPVDKLVAFLGLSHQDGVLTIIIPKHAFSRRVDRTTPLSSLQ
jgi:hypothetical protein